MAGISSRKLNEKITLILIFFAQTIVSLIFWLLLSHSFKLELNTFLMTILAGVFQALGLFFFYRAMRSENISLISPIFASCSVLTIIYGIFFLRENIFTSRAIAISMIVPGVILASINLPSKKKPTSILNKSVLTALIGTGFFAIDFLLYTLALKRGEFYLLNTIYAGSTLLFALLVFHKEISIKYFRSIFPKFFILIPILVGLLYAIGNNLYGFSLKYIPAYLGSAIFNAYPSIAVLLGYFFLKERLLPNQIIGVAVVTGGLILSAFPK